MKKNNEFNSSRRDLLKGLSSAAVVGVVVSATTHAVTASEIAHVENTDETHTGYHETQHIRDYYDSL